MNKLQAFRLKIVGVFFGIAAVLSFGVYAWCYSEGNCSGACIAIGQNVDSVCFGTAIRFGLAVFVAGLTAYKLWELIRYR